MIRIKLDTFYAIIFFIIGFLLSNPYRDYVYKNNIQDFGLADIGANLVVVPILCFSVWSFNINLSRNRFYEVVMVTLFYCFTEILIFFINRIGVFDFMDLVGYIIGGMITLVLLKRHNKCL